MKNDNYEKLLGLRLDVKIKNPFLCCIHVPILNLNCSSVDPPSGALMEVPTVFFANSKSEVNIMNVFEARVSFSDGALFEGYQDLQI